MTRSIVKSGNAYISRKVKRYEKTSTDDEVVLKRIGSKGTADDQVKLYVAGAVPAGVFDYQVGNEGYNSTTGKYDDSYCHDGKNALLLEYGSFTFIGTLDDGQTITKGMKLMPESGTGKLQKWDGSNPIIAEALQSVTASGADADIECLFILPMMPVIIEETLNVVTNVATLTYVPIMIEYIEAVAGSATGGVKLLTTNSPIATLNAKLVRASKTLTFWGTDGVTSCKVRYMANVA